MIQRYKKSIAVGLVCVGVLSVFAFSFNYYNVLKTRKVEVMLMENLNKCFAGEYVRILETTKERQGCIKSAVRELLDIYSTKVLAIARWNSGPWITSRTKASVSRRTL